MSIRLLKPWPEFSDEYLSQKQSLARQILARRTVKPAPGTFHEYTSVSAVRDDFMKKKTTNLFSTKYRYFSSDGREYVITTPMTPRPWVNVISNGYYGIVLSQTGSGYSWRTHAQLNRITSWEQDLIKDEWGRSKGKTRSSIAGGNCS